MLFVSNPCDSIGCITQMNLYHAWIACFLPLKDKGVPFDLPKLNPKVPTKTNHKHESHCLDEKLDVIGKNQKCQSYEKSQTSYVFKSGITIKMSYNMWTLHEV